MSSKSTISVIIPVYNAASYLAECLDSIFISQAFRDFVVICCDDVSTDESPNILAQYAKQYPLQMRIIRHTKNRGPAAALNTLMRAAESRYITFQDADDVMHPERLQRVCDFLETHKDIDMVGSGFTFFEQDVPQTTTPPSFLYFPDDHTIRSVMLVVNSMTGGVATIRTSSLRAANIWQNETMRGGYSHDYDFLARLAPHFRFANISESLYFYRQHQTQATAIFREKQVKSAMQIAKRHLARCGVRTTLNALRAFYARHTISSDAHALRCRQKGKKLIKKIERVVDFYGYPAVSVEGIWYMWDLYNDARYNYDGMSVSLEHSSTQRCMSIINMRISVMNICVSMANTCISIVNMCMSIVNIRVSVMNRCISIMKRGISVMRRCVPLIKICLRKYPSLYKIARKVLRYLKRIKRRVVNSIRA